ncbi:S8 family peptidase [Merdimonas faecis]|uniref:S8 family peptidase n=1 Tax=Merdimonas faecis TaxID=1653435 RepID=UPI0023F7671D|nr:S8 family peptidase [Merdimonas faecis]
MAVAMERVYENQKIENILNLAMDATPAERERSPELETGYDQEAGTWELIIKYSGSLEAAAPLAEEITELLNEYAIVRIREERIRELAALPEVEYIEKPKRLFFEVENGRRVSCIDSVQDSRFSLFGKGVLIGVIDSGIDYANLDFRKEDGTTRIIALWDQQLEQVYKKQEINEALEKQEPGERVSIVPSVDSTGHGTAVAGIAAGNGRGSGGRYAGAAPESELIVVKMGRARQDGFPRTTELIRGIDFVIRKAMELKMPVAVNISFGNTYGSHDGTSLLERFIDDMANIWKNVICIGTGNEAASAGHAAGVLTEGKEEVIQLAVENRQTGFSIQIWKNYTDEAEIALISPSGIKVGPFQERLGPQRFSVEQTEILLYYGEPSPYSTAQEIYVELLPQEAYVGAGVWEIVLTPVRIVSGNYSLWLPSENVLNQGTGFLLPSSQTTLTIPSTAARVISVGAYNSRTFAYADFSGRGGIWQNPDVKPDLAAPGVDVTTVAAGGGYAQFTGTSFAVPFVTGGAALLMEWGIIRGNDPYLYGEKVKAYLQRGARPLPGFTEYPNPQVGYGALCVRESLPV